MKKNTLFIILLLLTGLANWSCSREGSVSSAASDAAVPDQEIQVSTLRAIYQEFNPDDFTLDSAWILPDKNSENKMLKLYGKKTSSGKTESLTTYILVKPDGIGGYTPVPAGPSGTRIVSCQSLDCAHCRLTDIWSDESYCDCMKASVPAGSPYECNMNEAYSKFVFNVKAAEDGLIYVAGKTGY